MQVTRGLEAKIHNRTPKCHQNTYLEKWIILTLKGSMNSHRSPSSESNLIISESKKGSPIYAFIY